MDYRIERDSIGGIQVPSDKYWAAQTQRSLENFKIGDQRMPIEIIRAFAVLKKCAAMTNHELGVLSEEKMQLISQVCDEIVAGGLDADALVEGGATTNAAIGTYFPGFSFPGASGAANNKQGVSIGTIFSATEQAKIQITGSGAGGTGSAEGYIWYHIIDDGQESA